MGATAGLAIGAVSATNSIIGSRNAARAAKAQGEYQADIYGLNATVAERQAQDAIARGQEAESRSRGVTRQVAGRQRAALAAAGVDIGVGSAVDVQAETAELGELDALTIRNNARREAWGYDMEAAQARMSAVLARAGGQNQAAAYNNQAFSTLLTGGLQVWQGAGDAGRALSKRRRGGSSSSSSSSDWRE